MKKNLLFAASVLTIGGFLAACGSEETTGTGSDPVEETTTTPEDTVEEAVEEETAEDTPAEETATDEEPEEQPDDSTSDTAGEEAAEETEEEETVADTGSTNRAETEGTLTSSDEQAYDVYVLPGYELTSEEPGKDSLYLIEDGSVFMRIETFDPATLDFAGAEDSLTQTLAAINSEAELTEGTLEGDFINSVMYEVPSDSVNVTGIVFEKENLVVRLTIYDTAEADATEDFIEMGKTVQASE